MAHISLNPSILDRASFSADFSLPEEVDGLVGGFAEKATDWRTLAAMTAGGLAYRAGRLGMMGLGNGSALGVSTTLRVSATLRAASVGLGLTAEVSTFEFASRSLVGGNSNLWRWNGKGGIRQGLFQSFITFGSLKGAGRLSAGENILIQHALQDGAMVAGHQISGALNLAPRPTGSLAKQFLHAEATNLQIGAGMALAGRMAPGLQAFEAGLDISLRKGDGRPVAAAEFAKSLSPVTSNLSSGSSQDATLWNGILLMSAPKDPKHEISSGGFLSWTGLQSLLRPFRSEDLVALTLSAEHNPKFVFLLKRKADEGDTQALNALKNLKTDYLSRFALKMPEAVQALGELRLAGNRRAAQDLRRLDVSNLAARALGDPGHMNALVLAAGYGEFGNPGAVDALMPLADKNLEALSALHRLAFTGNERVAHFLRQLDLHFLLPQAEVDAHAFTLLAFLVRMDHPEALPLLAQAARKQGVEVGPLQSLASDDVPGALPALQKAAETNFRAVLALGNLIQIPEALEALEKAAQIHLVAVESLDSLAHGGTPGAIEALFRVSDVNPQALPLLYSLTESENKALSYRAFQVLTGREERENPAPGGSLSKALQKLKEAPDLAALREAVNVLGNLATQDPEAVLRLNEMAWNRERMVLASLAKGRLEGLETHALALQAKWNPRAVTALSALSDWRNLDAETTLPTLKIRDLLKTKNLKEAWVAVHLLAEAGNLLAWDAFLRANPHELVFRSPLSGSDLFALYLLARAENEAALDLLAFEAESDPRCIFALEHLMKNAGVLRGTELMFQMPTDQLAERAQSHPDAVSALSLLSQLGNKEARIALENLDVSTYAASAFEKARSLGTLILLSSHGNKSARAHLKANL